MPAMLSHYLIGRRVLRQAALPSIPRRDAFMIGVQGPDILFFHRVYPWQPGQATFRLGNALHEVRPSKLIDALYAILHSTPVADRNVVYSYMLGFLCHYAADRTVHPFVCYRQEQLREREPRFAKQSNQYHYRIESALDVRLLRHDTGQQIDRAVLTAILPPKDERRDRAIGHMYARLIPMVLHQTVSETLLYKMVDDMRESMWLMTDRCGMKRSLLSLGEKVLHTGALLSPLLRSGKVYDYDYPNCQHDTWYSEGEVPHTEDFFALCDKSVALSVTVINGFAQKQSGQALTQDVDFAGCAYHDKEGINE